MGSGSSGRRRRCRRYRKVPGFRARLGTALSTSFQVRRRRGLLGLRRSARRAKKKAKSDNEQTDDRYLPTTSSPVATLLLGNGRRRRLGKTATEGVATASASSGLDLLRLRHLVPLSPQHVGADPLLAPAAAHSRELVPEATDLLNEQRVETLIHSSASSGLPRLPGAARMRVQSGQ